MIHSFRLDSTGPVRGGVMALALTLLGIGSANTAAAAEPLTLAEFADHVTTNYNRLSSDSLRYATALKRMIEDGAAVIQYYLTYQEQSFKAFTGGDGVSCPYNPCGQFRDELQGMLVNYQESLNLIPQGLSAYARIQGTAPLPSLPPVDISPLRSILETAPAFILFPYYEALTQLTGDASETLANLNRVFDRTEEALDDVQELGEAVAAAGGGNNGLVCQVLATELGDDSVITMPQIATTAATLLSVGAAIHGVVGDFKILAGMRGVKKVEGELSLVGEATSAADINALAFVGSVHRFISKVTEAIGTGLFKTTNRCRLRLNNQVLFCMLNEKNLHRNSQFDSLNSCLDRVRAGDSNFGF